MARNNYEIMIAFRFLLKGRGQTILILLGIAMGVAVQFFLSSLIGGLQISLIDRVVGSSPHITVLPPDVTPKPVYAGSKGIKDTRKVFYSEKTEIFSWQQYVADLKKDSGVTFVAPVVNGSGFIERGTSIMPVIIKGTDAEGLNIYRIKKTLTSGTADIEGEKALIGKNIADKLALTTGDKFFLRNNKGDQIFMLVGGVFDLGASAGNDILLISLNRARSFLDVSGISAIEVQVKDVFKAEKKARDYAKLYDRVKLQSWQEKNRELLTALSSQSSSSNTIQFFVLFSISLGIASVLGIAAVQKQRQLGILKAIGATNSSAAKIFIAQGAVLGLFGSLIGVVTGLLLAYAFIAMLGPAATFGFEITPFTIITPVVLAVFASTFSAMIPAAKASKLSPIEVIRNG